MTQLLETAFARVQELPDAEQDAIAAVILEELDDERRWQSAFEASAAQLAALGAEALAEFRQGRTRELRIDDL